jgi:hypothetical protein
MNKRGLLHKTNFNTFTKIVLCIYLLGSLQITNRLIVKAATGTEPAITISAPNTGTLLNTKNVTISGTIENFPSDTTVSIYRGEENIGSTIVVTGNAWSVPVTLQEGVNSLYAKAADTGGAVTEISSTINLTVDTTLPIITFLNPIDNGFSNTPSLELASEPGSAVQICMDCTEDTEGKIVGVWGPVDEVAANPGKWVYQDNQMTQGRHTVYAKATDSAGNIGLPSHITFTLDTLRPIILLDSLFPKPDMSQVSINTVIKFKVGDVTALNELELGNSLQLTRNGTDIPVKLLGYNSTSKEVTFEPLEPLSRSTKYYVVISPMGVKDLAGNRAFPKVWSFTTESTAPVLENGKNGYNLNYNGKTTHRESPHEVYTNNTNICGNCHNTHAASNPNLLDQKKNSETNNGDLTVDNYCMACHDGTVAPIAENSQSTHKHNADIDLEGKPNGSSCSTCHNPHTEWSQNNPNLIQGHITYTHDPTLPDPDKPTGEISSKAQLCESCHETDSADKIANPLVEYRLFDYKKSNNAIGIYEDYQLCLRCHNSILKQKNQQTADIAKYYDNLTLEKMKAYEEINKPSLFVNRELSPEEINFSRHIIKAQDGSTLAGHIPCAECHDTHGSNNIKVLKAKLGHEDIQSFSAAETDKTTDGVLTATKEQEFCKKCHNGTTAIYGVTGKKYDELRTEHKDYPDKPCSYCHGRGETDTERALSAAHAPKIGVIPSP